MALLFEGWYQVQREDHLRQSATTLIYLAALAAVVTALIGAGSWSSSTARGMSLEAPTSPEAPAGHEEHDHEH